MCVWQYTGHRGLGMRNSDKNHLKRAALKTGLGGVVLWGMLLLQTGCGQEGSGAEGGSGNVSINGNVESGGNLSIYGSVESGGNAADLEAPEIPEITLRQMELLECEDPENENLADMLQRAGGGMMVQLQAGNVRGSGVLYGIRGEDLVILTAAHVLQETEDAVAVTFADEWSVLADGYECSAMGDYAVVRVSGESVPAEHLEQYLCVNVDKDSFDAATAGTGCIVMGCRSGVAAEAYEGVILDHWIYMEDYGQYMMWVKAEGQQGMSGGGLFDRQGHFLGILSGGNEDGELAVVPLSLILAEPGAP